MHKEANNLLRDLSQKELEYLVNQTKLERTMREHIEYIMKLSGNVWNVEHPYKGFSLEKMEKMNPFIYIIPLIDTQKRDEYVNWVLQHPDKETPEEIVYEPADFYGIHEDEQFVTITLFENNLCTDRIQIPTPFYYGVMAEETKEIIRQIFLTGKN